ncbi:hypothetical protein AHAS_Ahas15G0177700 [Arachis hypogaea]
MELGATGELPSQRRKGEANVTHEEEGGAAVEPCPVAVVRASPLSFAEGETRREDDDLHHHASLPSSSLHHCCTLFPLPLGGGVVPLPLLLPEILVIAVVHGKLVVS